MNTAGSSTPKKISPAIDWKRILRLGLPLLILLVAAGLILSLVNTLTADAIARHETQRRQELMQSVMPSADVFSELYCQDETITGISGAYQGTRFKGYCIEVAPTGCGDSFSLLVGVSSGGAVTGIAILEHSQTGSVGVSTDYSDFLHQYIGRSGTITVNGTTNSIRSVSDTPITGEAITEGVNTALTAALHYTAEGGPQFDDGEV